MKLHHNSLMHSHKLTYTVMLIVILSESTSSRRMDIEDLYTTNLFSGLKDNMYCIQLFRHDPAFL